MKYSLGLVATLILFWIVLSGHYTPLLLGFGAASIALVVWLSHRMKIVDHESQLSGLRPRIGLYWLWLAGQIMRSAIQVTIHIWSHPLRIAPGMRYSSNTGTDDLNTVIYANSITLTPGTLAVSVDEKGIEVHALHTDSLDELDQGDMRRRVRALHQ